MQTVLERYPSKPTLLFVAFPVFRSYNSNTTDTARPPMKEKDALGNAQANNARIYSLMFDVYEKVRNAKESIYALIACGADYYKGYKIVGGGIRKSYAQQSGRIMFGAQLCDRRIWRAARRVHLQGDT